MQKSRELTKAKQRILTFLFRQLRKSAHQRGIVDAEFFLFIQDHVEVARNEAKKVG